MTKRKPAISKHPGHARRATRGNAKKPQVRKLAKPQPAPQLSATLMLLYFGTAITLLFREPWWAALLISGALVFVLRVAVR